MTSISLAGVSKAFGFECAVLEMDLEIASGEFVVFVGPSGCGKSTLLRMIAGLEAVSGGRILFDNIDVTALPPDKRDVAMVFQSYALYPHMTAAQNLSFGLRMTGCPAADIARRVEHAVDMLRLEDYLHKKPSQLSGGQCQRVAIGRALVQQPKVFLFDEPLSNLDAELRVSMRVEIAALHRSLDNTMIYVTHDQVEAMTLADRIVVLRNGGIEQVGTPREIYGEPQNVFVAEFMGYPKINILQGTVVDDGGIFLRLDSMARIPLGVLSGAVEVGEKVSVGIRPESISLKQQAHKQQAQGAQFEMFVDFVEHVGAGTNYFGRIGGDEFRIALSEGQKYQPGDPVRIGLAEEQLHFFDARGERLGKRQTPE